MTMIIIIEGYDYKLNKNKVEPFFDTKNIRKQEGQFALTNLHCKQLISQVKNKFFLNWKIQS
jgi:hypothetical protein